MKSHRSRERSPEKMLSVNNVWTSWTKITFLLWLPVHGRFRDEPKHKTSRWIGRNLAPLIVSVLPSHLCRRCDVPNFQPAAAPITYDTNLYIMSRKIEATSKMADLTKFFRAVQLESFKRVNHVSKKRVDLTASIFPSLMNALLLGGIVPSCFLNFTWLQVSLIVANIYP